MISESNNVTADCIEANAPIAGLLTAVTERAHLGSSSQWHLITPEYPPQTGGVSDYTKSVAAGLAAAGDVVHVWCPAGAHDTGPTGVFDHNELGGATPADLRRLGRQLDRFPAPRRILVQWVPHGYGYRSMNLAFCLWLWSRSRRYGDKIEIMVHEPFLSFGEGNWRQDAAALVHRLMTVILLQAAERVWVSIPEWERRWRRYSLGSRAPFQWLPIPSNIPVVDDAGSVQDLRRRYTSDGGLLIGHFGTYGIPVASILEPVLLNNLAEDLADPSILLIGIGADRFRTELVRKAPGLAAKVHAADHLSAEAISIHIAACDLMIQPYPSGVSSRRTSLMAGLSHGKPIVTSSGDATEPLWAASGAVALAPAEDPDALSRLVKHLCADAGKRLDIGRAARQLYQDRFDISHTIASLRAAGPPKPECAF